MERVEQLKSTPSSEDEMDMMTMMMMQFSSPNSEEFLRQPDEEELINLYGAANNNNNNNNTRPLADLIDNPPAASIPPSWSSNSNSSSPFTHLPSTTISFTNNHTPTQMLQPPTLLFPQNNVNEGANSNYPNYTGPCSSEKRNSSSSSMAAMREMIFRIAAMQPINIDPEAVKAPKRKNVKISKDPQSVAARHRRERISERIRILQRLVPGGTKMDTASMLDEAIHYVKFLKTQVQSLERVGVGVGVGVGVAANNNNSSSSTPANNSGIGFPVAMSTRSTASAIPTPTPYFSDLPSSKC